MYNILVCIIALMRSTPPYSILTTLAEAPMDYGVMETVLIFRACETRACTNVAILDDNVAEPTERFSVKLSRTDGLDSGITLDPIVAEVEIIDYDRE